MENTNTQAGYSLLMTYSSALAYAQQELVYWESKERDDVTNKEIEKWVMEIQKYEKFIEEFLKKTPIGQDDWFVQFTEWISKAFDVFWYIFKKINEDRKEK